MVKERKKIIITIPWYKHYTKILMVLALFIVAAMAAISLLSPKQLDIIGIETITTTTIESVPAVPNPANDILGQPVALLPFGLSVYTWIFLIVGFALAWKVFHWRL